MTGPKGVTLQKGKEDAFLRGVVLEIVQARPFKPGLDGGIDEDSLARALWQRGVKFDFPELGQALTKLIQEGKIAIDTRHAHASFGTPLCYFAPVPS